MFLQSLKSHAVRDCGMATCRDLGVKRSTTPRVLGMAGTGGNQIGDTRLLYGGGSETGVLVAVC